MKIKKAQKIFFNLGYFRILHSAANLASVDIYIDDKLVAEDLSFGKYTAYFPMFEESYKVSLSLSNAEGSIVLNQRLSIAQYDILTLAIIESEGQISFMSIQDKNVAIEPGKSMLRFVHLSQNTSALDIALPDGTIIAGNISYLHGTSYLSAEPSTYSFQARLTGSAVIVLNIPEVPVSANDYYTVYIIGLSNQNPALQSLVLLDGFK